MEAGVEGERMKGCTDYILEPLSLPESQAGGGGEAISEGFPVLPCVFCEIRCPAAEKDKLLKHMCVDHKLVIADVKLIADFSRYVLYWREQFKKRPITDYCSVIRTNSEGPVEAQEDYFLLCDVLPEDRVLREQLQQRRLEEILEQQQQERNDTGFHGVCLFCSEEFTGNRSVLFNHMAKDHGFNVGLPDNIVYCNMFLETLQKKLDNLQCLYCEKTFRDKNALKDHMRKKQHRRINAKNQEYDQFYTINYLELGKTWEEVQSEDDRELIENQEDDWSDWQDHPICAVCLFCELQADTTEKLYDHMKDAHGFDLLQIKTMLGLNFYQQVKLVNFIRREIHQCRCHGCQKKFSSKAEVVSHMAETEHIMSLPDRSIWDQPQYYFPTYENDTLLCALSDSESDSAVEDQKEEILVIGEDISNLQALKQSSVLNQLLRGETPR
ncbi:zinc finger protein 277 isoform X1 [Latimeria chalumnae]|uniref:Zinc finger protein 277 n=1 Tax=Latimeria chalumnae TaxID=7897 RepID=H3AHU9_LATCH|nr:PREDICTED: zinc finger protein 277 isoform X1 [Latimeria chalumnae]|eukprot:XP_005999634.1 PREDICTED: zinc finger protein 277 isoform X1 [Latimeria chalumnae]